MILRDALEIAATQLIEEADLIFVLTADVSQVQLYLQLKLFDPRVHRLIR